MTANDPTAPSFAFSLRVYYEDTDTGGVVFYANYLKFFERARTEWLRTAGISQQQLSQTHDVMFVVTETAVKYLRAARLDDLITIDSRVERLGRASINFEQQAFRSLAAEVDPNPGNAGQRELVARASIKVGCVSRSALRPVAIPDHVRMFIHSITQSHP